MITLFTDTSASISNLFLNTIIDGIFVLFILYLMEKYILDKLLSFVVNSKSDEIFIATIILLVLASSLLSHIFGFSYSLGAFIAGILIAKTKYKYKIESQLIPFRDMLLGLFFITVGIQVNLEFVWNNLFVIVGLSVAILFLKGLLIFILINIFSHKNRAFKTALTLAQIGEFSFAIFALALSNHLITTQLHQIMVSVVIISLIFTSIVLKYVKQFANTFSNLK
jgi:CPA2 family monovalent cation:H+ antiporter-2